MAQTRDWKEMWNMAGRLLQERSGEDVEAWNRRILEQAFTDEKSLRDWLTQQGVGGYAQNC